MTIRQIELTEARDALKECIAERGEDFVYRKPMNSLKCLYIHRNDDDTTTPGCGVGMALLKLGVPESAFIGSISQNFAPVQDLYLEGFKLTDDALHYLSTFQNEQDCMATWGESLAIADRSAGIED